MEIGDWRPLFPTRVGEELGDIGAARFNIYNKELESQLIMATSEFYARESSQWIGTDSCPEYMKKVPGLCFGISEKALFSSGFYSLCLRTYVSVRIPFLLHYGAHENSIGPSCFIFFLKFLILSM